MITALDTYSERKRVRLGAAGPAILLLAALALPSGAWRRGNGTVGRAPTIGPTLDNPHLHAEFGPAGLTRLVDLAHQDAHALTRDAFRITIDGRTYASASLGAPARHEYADSIAYEWTTGPLSIRATYELRRDWHFVSKRLAVTSTAPAFHVDSIAVWDAALGQIPTDVYVVKSSHQNLGPEDYAAALRFSNGSGMLALAQNPFLHVTHARRSVHGLVRAGHGVGHRLGAVRVRPRPAGALRLSGRTVPDKMLPEWRWQCSSTSPDWTKPKSRPSRMRAGVPALPAGESIDIMVGWCANDYQIDIATAEGRAEYKRILDMAARLGAEHVLFAPANSEVSRREDSRDDWKWEYVLWLGLGQKIRKNEWDPSSGAIPASVQEMLDYARSKKLGLVAYVYPVMGFTEKPEWLVGARGTRANLGVHSFQDWLIGALEGFLKHTGISGYAFDHTFLNYEGASKYAQWWGWRRVMETLRRDIPDIVIDGRQAYQNYGPWTWLAGSYPHPTSTDEQPESFVSFPDLKLDRVSADRERYTAYRYRNYEFAPSEIVPGSSPTRPGATTIRATCRKRKQPWARCCCPFDSAIGITWAGVTR